MQNRGFKPPANAVAYRTVYNEVEAIKAYLRKFKPSSDVEIDDELIREMVSEYMSGYTSTMISNVFGDFVMNLISPLRTEYVNNDFIDYIIKDITTCSCTSAETIELISNNFMSIVDYNSESFFNYLSDNFTVNITSGDVINIITENRTEILNYISEDIYNVISDDTLDLISNNFMTIVKENHSAFISYIESYVECDVTSDIIISVISSNQDEIMKYISGTVFSYISDDVLALISPLQTSYVTTAFIDYIIKDIATYTDATIIDIVSNNFMSIVDYNSESFFNYLSDNFTVNITSSDVINIITENKDTILNYISGDIYEYISGYISDPSTNVTQVVQQAIVDQYPELDVKYLLRDYHLIDKHCINLTSNVLTIPTDSLYNPASGFERFRLLAYVSSDSTVIEPLTDFNQVLIENGKYQFYDPASGENSIAAELTSADTGLSLFLTGFFNGHFDNQSVLWYGFTDLINPESGNPPDYAVLVSIDCSPNYLKLMDYNNGVPTGYMTVSYTNRKAYNGAYATNVRQQFGGEIEVVEVVPHPLLINDSERYIVIRAITSSENKGYWKYRGENNAANAYTYNKQYNRSVLTFSPLESPIIYANVKVGASISNVYYYQLSETFKDRTDIYSIDLSNFVPFDNVLPENLTDVTFTNINAGEDAKNFGKLQWPNAFNGCTNLASIDIRFLTSFNPPGGSTSSQMNQFLLGCANLRAIYCDKEVGVYFSNNIIPNANMTTFTDMFTWSYDDAIGAIVFSEPPKNTTQDSTN